MPASRKTSRISRMLRAVEAWLIVVFSLGLIAPALSADPESQLPACCRRLGQHQCSAMQGADRNAPGARVSAVPVKCPFFPSSTVVTPSHGNARLMSATHSGVSLSFRAAMRRAQTIALYRASFSRLRQKRGPPMLVL